MNYSNITTGDVYKTYIDFCKALGTTPAPTCSKPTQLKNISRYIKFHRRGQKIIVDDVYDKPHLSYPIPPRRDRRKKLPKNIYGNYIQALILQELLQNDGNIIKSRIELMKSLGMVNTNYANKHLSETPPLSLFKVRYFQYLYHRNFRRVLNSALDALEKEKVITVTHIINLISADGKQCTIASPKESRQIIDAEKTIFHTMSYFQMRPRIMSLGYSQYFHRLQIKLNPEYVITPLDTKEIHRGRLLLNEEVVEGFRRLFKRHCDPDSHQDTTHTIQNLFQEPTEIIQNEFETFTNFFIKLQ